MPLRFEQQFLPEPGCMRETFKIFAGKMEIGHIVKLDRLGRDQIRWEWVINQLVMGRVSGGIDHGTEATIDDARRKVDDAWSQWVAAAGLRETSNAPSD